jgi:hypothetical protein
MPLVVTAPARREVVREMVTHGLSERRALTVVRMSAAALRYVPRPDPDPGLRDRIVALAHLTCPVFSDQSLLENGPRKRTESLNIAGAAASSRAGPTVSGAAVEPPSCRAFA